MNEKKAKEGIKIDISQGESTFQGEEKSQGDKKDISEDKQLEKMTKAELIEKVKELQEKAEEVYDQYLRAKAEIDNIIKRNKKEKEEWIKYSNETLIKELLSVMDNLEKAISHSDNRDSFHALREGVELTLKGLKDTLVKSGLEEVKTEGQPFDPCFHHAVAEQDDKNVEAGMILNELQKGYILNKRLIRPAMVVLSKGNSKNGNNLKETPNGVCEEKKSEEIARR